MHAQSNNMLATGFELDISHLSLTRVTILPTTHI